MAEKKQSFGAYLREKRVAKEYSLRRFAEMLGVSPTYLSHVEQDKVDSPITAKLAKRAAELLGENPDEMVAMAGRVPEDLPKIIQSQPEAMPALLRAVKGLTPEQIRKLQEQAKKMRDAGGDA
jgi:transcriptional regulator with XRE-family HTH domain